MKLKDRVAVVTGASMGIGEAIAKEFVLEGAFVVMCSRDAERCEAARQRIGNLERTVAWVCDVKDEAQVRSLVGQVRERYGRIDLWVNNAGIGLLDSVETMDMDKCRVLMETNLFGALRAMQQVLPIMRDQGSGTVVNISSVAGYVSLPFSGAYSASKSALNAVSYAARMELRGTGVNVLNVCPGFVTTNLGRNAMKGSRYYRGGGSQAPMSVAPERIARAVVKGCVKRKREVIVPWFYRLLVAFHQCFPGAMDSLMARKMCRKY